MVESSAEANKRRVAAWRARKRSEDPAGFKQRENAARKARRLRRNPPAPPAANPQVAEEKQQENAVAAPLNLHNKIEGLIGRLNSYLNDRSQLNIPDIEILLEKKLIPAIVEANEFENCDALFEAVWHAKLKIAEHTGKKITKKSVKEQYTNVRNLYKYMHGSETDCSNFDFLKDTKKVIKFINDREKWSKPASKNKQIQSISSILKVLKGFDAAYQIYSKKSTADTKSYVETKGDIKMSDAERKNFLMWPQIQKILIKKHKIDPSPRDRALMSLYVYLPPRRVEDIRLLTLSTNGKNLNDKFNYLVLDKGKPKELVYNVYKTAKTFGQQTIPVPDDLAEVLKTYIKYDKIKNKGVMFGTDGEYYQQFSQVIANTFKKYSGKSVGANILRHSFIQNFLKGKRTPNEKKEIADMMAHSVLVQSYYDRV